MAQAQAFETAHNVEKINALSAEVIELRNEGRRSADNSDLKLQITNINTATAPRRKPRHSSSSSNKATFWLTCVPQSTVW